MHKMILRKAEIETF